MCFYVFLEDAENGELFDGSKIKTRPNSELRNFLTSEAEQEQGKYINRIYYTEGTIGAAAVG